MLVVSTPRRAVGCQVYGLALAFAFSSGVALVHSSLALCRSAVGGGVGMHEARLRRLWFAPPLGE